MRAGGMASSPSLSRRADRLVSTSVALMRSASPRWTRSPTGRPHPTRISSSQGSVVTAIPRLAVTPSSPLTPSPSSPRSRCRGRGPDEQQAPRTAPPSTVSTASAPGSASSEDSRHTSPRRAPPGRLSRQRTLLSAPPLQGLWATRLASARAPLWASGGRAHGAASSISA